MHHDNSASKTSLCVADDPQAVVLGWLRAARAAGCGIDVFEGRRKYTRYLWREPLEILVKGELVYAYSRNVSANGLALLCKRDLAGVTRVYVRRDSTDGWVPARVRHVTQSVSDHLVGLEFDHAP